MTGTKKPVEILLRNYVAPRMEGYKCHGRLLYRAPVGLVLEGFYFDRSATKNAFYIWGFVQPLYCLSDDVCFSFGERLRDVRRHQLWEIDEDLMETVGEDVLVQIAKGQRWLEQINTVEKVYANLKKLRGKPYSSYVLQAVAYSSVLINGARQALKDLSALKQNLEEHLTIPWCRQMKDEADEIETWVRADILTARERLKEFARQTAAHINIGKDL